MAGRSRYIQCPDTNKLIPAEEYYTKKYAETPYIQASFKEFRSNVDGTMVTDPSSLREHNLRNGVSNLNDYGENNGKAYFDRHHKARSEEMLGTSKKQVRDRKHLLSHLLDQQRVN